MKCPNCEMEIPAGIPFCPFCSAEIKSETTTASFHQEEPIVQSMNDFGYAQASAFNRGTLRPLFEQPEPEMKVAEPERVINSEPVFEKPEDKNLKKQESEAAVERKRESNDEKKELSETSVSHRIKDHKINVSNEVSQESKKEAVSRKENEDADSGVHKIKDAKRKIDERGKKDITEESKKPAFEKITKEAADEVSSSKYPGEKKQDKKKEKKRSKKKKEDVIDRNYEIADGDIVNDDPYNINEDRYYDNVEPVSLDELKQSPKIIMTKVLLGLAAAAAVILTLIYYVG